MPGLTIIADDLTGAADAAAPFAVSGYATYVAIDYGNLPEADVLAISTESRRLDVADAAQRVRQAAREAPAHLVFKKIDSTLRGHPAAELLALRDELGRGGSVIAPAFPAQGRMTIAGRQHVHGRPLDETPLRDEIASADLLELFPGAELIDLEAVWEGEAALRRLMQGTPARTWVADAETDDDLSALCSAALGAGIDLFCGSGGLAEALSRSRPFVPQSPPRPVARRRGGVLIVAGSRHAATLAQVAELARRGALVFDPDRVEEAADGLRQGRLVVIATGEWRASKAGGGETAAHVAATVRRVVDAGLAGSLVVTGGDIAAAVCRELGAAGLWIDGQALPGMPLGRLHGGPHEGLSVGTKAGGFGDREALEMLRRAVAQALETGR